MESGRERKEVEEMLKRSPRRTSSGVALEAIDVVGNRSYAEWVVTAKQTSDLALDDDILTEIIETPITLRGVTVARFVGDRIEELRQCWDEVPLREGLGLIPAD